MAAESARNVVLAYIEALNREDFAEARRYIDNEISFEGALGSRHGADAYLADMTRMHLKYEVKKVFVDGDDVCLLYNVTMSGVTVFTAGWYRLREGKIHSLRVVFDPRPLLKDKAA